MADRKHILTSFDEGLDTLQADVQMMAALTERSLRNAMRGLFEGETELCSRAIADDEEVDQLEKDVQQEGIAILLRFQPLASDLRQVVSAMRLSGDLERVADQAVNIAKKVRRLAAPPDAVELELLQQMFDCALELFGDSMASYKTGDVELALSLKARDRKLDELNAAITNRATGAMMRFPARASDYLCIIFIARHLERVGDHAKNIAENAVYAVAAEDIRHRPVLPAP